MTPPLNIRDLCAKATPGPWESHDIGHGLRIEPSVAWLGNTSSHPYAQTKANAALIARLSPDVVLKVTQALERAQTTFDYSRHAHGSTAMKLIDAALSALNQRE